MNRVTAGAAMLLAISLTFSGAALAAGEQHDHQTTPASAPQISAPAVQPSHTDTMPSLGSADDMLKAMESMPSHNDHDACCKLSKSPPAANGHDHDH
jgi:hypothetical protein